MTDGKLYCYFVRKIGKNDDGGGRGSKIPKNLMTSYVNDPYIYMNNKLKMYVWYPVSMVLINGSSGFNYSYYISGIISVIRLLSYKMELSM